MQLLVIAVFEFTNTAAIATHSISIETATTTAADNNNIDDANDDNQFFLFCNFKQ